MLNFYNYTLNQAGGEPSATKTRKLEMSKTMFVNVKNTLKLLTLLTLAVASSACTQTFSSSEPADFTYHGIEGFADTRELYAY